MFSRPINLPKYISRYHSYYSTIRHGTSEKKPHTGNHKHEIEVFELGFRYRIPFLNSRYKPHHIHTRKSFPISPHILFEIDKENNRKPGNDEKHKGKGCRKKITENHILTVTTRYTTYCCYSITIEYVAFKNIFSTFLLSHPKCFAKFCLRGKTG